MSEQLSQAAAVWHQAMSISERSLRPIPKHPEAQLYRRMTILSDAIAATVEAGLVPQTSLEEFYAEVDEARAQAQAVNFDQLSHTESLDKSRTNCKRLSNSNSENSVSKFRRKKWLNNY